MSVSNESEEVIAMRQHEFRIQVDDVLYESSIERKEVIEHRVTNIFVEDYRRRAPKTVVLVKAPKYGTFRCVSPEVISCWHETLEEAQECLEEMLV